MPPSMQQIFLPCSRGDITASSCMCSVVPVLDAKQIQHRMHLSVDTIEAPASAAGQIIRDTADSVGAQLVIVGHNRQPVGILRKHAVARRMQDDVP